MTGSGDALRIRCYRVPVHGSGAVRVSLWGDPQHVSYEWQGDQVLFWALARDQDRATDRWFRVFVSEEELPVLYRWWGSVRGLDRDDYHLVEIVPDEVPADEGLPGRTALLEWARVQRSGREVCDEARAQWEAMS